jgi:segregation and condensation protein B
MPDPTLEMRLQAILFVAAGPLSLAELTEATSEPGDAVSQSLDLLETSMQSGGVRLSRLDGQFRLVTAPEVASIVRKYLQDESSSDLSKPALETLAIVAYRGPLTKSAIETIRGVASDTMLRNLLARGLINEAGKSREPGRPVLYAISHAFLQHFGLTNSAELPAIPDEAAHEN